MALQLSRIQSRIHALRERIQSILWVEQLQSQTLWKRFLIRTSQIIVAVVRDLNQEQLSLRAMSLVFTTVIGFFPLFALTFAVLKSLGVHNAMEPTLLTLLQPLGERSAELTTQILSYVDNLQEELIGITSVGILLYIVLDMMRKIESSFNYIWAVEKGRSWSNRVSEYLFAVIVSPLLLFMSISLTSYINTNFFETLLQNLMFGGMLIVPLYSMIQQRTEGNTRARVISVNNIINALFMVAGALLGILFLSVLSWTIPQFFLAVAVINGLFLGTIFVLDPIFIQRFVAWVSRTPSPDSTQ